MQAAVTSAMDGATTVGATRAEAAYAAGRAAQKCGAPVLALLEAARGYAERYWPDTDQLSEVRGVERGKENSACQSASQAFGGHVSAVSAQIFASRSFWF